MKIYALIGPSGSGKSYRAIPFANEKGIAYIVDDGLLIKGNKILAGISAKKEATKIAAIRRALFVDPIHIAEVKKAIEENKPESILILGTSINMIKRIVSQLELPDVENITMISDIATENEIKTAQRQRREEGKHIIPVPTFEIRKDFSGYFIDALKNFSFYGKDKKIEAVEKTVVRPTYSYMGKFYIADSAIQSIAAYNAKNIEGAYKVLKTNIISREDGIIIFIDVVVVYGHRIDTVLENIQKKVAEAIIWTTGLNVVHINVIAKGIVRL